jgi:hypothetical protein
MCPIRQWIKMVLSISIIDTADQTEWDFDTE